MEQKKNDMAPIDVLYEDILGLILGFLEWKEIIQARVCRTWKEAACRAIVSGELLVDNRHKATALGWISQAIPKLMCLHITFPPMVDFCHGEDSDPDHIPRSPIDLTPIEKFQGLKKLSIQGGKLNGRYPFLFQFPQLESLTLFGCGRIKFDLADLSGLSELKQLVLYYLPLVTGNLNSLRHFQSQLKKLVLNGCDLVVGSMHDFADFSLLEKLCLDETAVTGDIRNIGPRDFLSVRFLILPRNVYGGNDIESIESATVIMRAIHSLKRPELFRSSHWNLWEESPQYYEVDCRFSRCPPFRVELVKAGTRNGWRWTNCHRRGACEINWLDPEVKETEDGYEQYLTDLQALSLDVDFYQGFRSPPTALQHAELCRTIAVDESFYFIYYNPPGS